MFSSGRVGSEGGLGPRRRSRRTASKHGADRPRAPSPIVEVATPSTSARRSCSTAATSNGSSDRRRSPAALSVAAVPWALASAVSSGSQPMAAASMPNATGCTAGAPSDSAIVGPARAAPRCGQRATEGARRRAGRSARRADTPGRVERVGVHTGGGHARRGGIGATHRPEPAADVRGQRARRHERDPPSTAASRPKLCAWVPSGKSPVGEEQQSGRRTSCLRRGSSAAPSAARGRGPARWCRRRW